MVALLVAAGAAVAVLLAEALHARRIRRVAGLVFGPARRPAPWVRAVPFLTAAAFGGLGWGLLTLLTLPPRIYSSDRSPAAEAREPRHVIVVLDVSPSMKLKDAGPEMKQTRARRVGELMTSFSKRAPVGDLLWSVVAVYNGAIPVVVDTRDWEVVRNILDDLPLHHAFDVGRTQLFAGLEEAAKIAAGWRQNSTTLLLLSDGDTVPATGLPHMPPSINEFLIVGVGDTRAGKFIDGHMSRQDASTLRQLAVRLGGTYHDGNQKQIPTDTLTRVTALRERAGKNDWSRREYALLACGVSAALLALLPLLLAQAGTSWRPGRRGSGAGKIGDARPHPPLERVH